MPPTVIGGLAAICRLGGAYRATSDLDTVNRRTADQPSQLEVLIGSGAKPADAAGVIIPTPAGDVKVDVLEVTDWDLQPLPNDPTDRLHVLAHAWAAQTATPMLIDALDPAASNGHRRVVAKVAEPGPLIAMKLQSVMNRPAAKEGTDLLDIVSLMLDSATRDIAVSQLHQTDNPMSDDIQLHTRHWFIDNRERTIRRIRAVAEGARIDDTTLDVVTALLLIG